MTKEMEKELVFILHLIRSNIEDNARYENLTRDQRVCLLSVADAISQAISYYFLRMAKYDRLRKL